MQLKDAWRLDWSLLDAWSFGEWVSGELVVSKFHVPSFIFIPPAESRLPNSEPCARSVWHAIDAIAKSRQKRAMKIDAGRKNAQARKR
jgi:hypothetical protein